MGFRDEKRPFVLRPAPMGRKAQVVVMGRWVGSSEVADGRANSTPPLRRSGPPDRGP